MVPRATIWNTAARELIRDTAVGLYALRERCNEGGGSDELATMHKGCIKQYVFGYNFQLWKHYENHVTRVEHINPVTIARKNSKTTM